MKDSNRMLPAGTSFNKSVVGHNNFVYPSASCDTLIEDVNYTTLSFVGGGSKAAVCVSEHAVKHNGDTEPNNYGSTKEQRTTPYSVGR